MDTNQSPNDILRVANIDVNCSLNDPEVHPEDPSKFTVYYGKNPYTVESGKTRLFPRFIADHFAKHLKDHLLTMNEQPVSSKEGEKYLKQIYMGVEESYSENAPKTDGERIAEQVEQIEQRLEPKVEKPVEEKKEEPVKEKPTLRELKAEADKLGIAYKPNVTVDQLLDLIRSF